MNITIAPSMNTNEAASGTQCDCILIIEDNDDIREALQMAIEGEGYRVFAVSNGQEALGVLKRIPGRPLVLLDMMMPVMSGWEFLEAQKANAVFGHLPVVVVTALGLSLLADGLADLLRPE